MIFKTLACLSAAALMTTAGLDAQSDQADRIREATRVFREIMQAPDSEIPGSVLGRPEGIAIFPLTLKGGFIFGGHRGKGILSVRERTAGTWSSPAFLTLT